MIINDKIIGLINYRIQQEEYSSRLYLAMSKWLNFNGYFGAAKLWQKYSDEELKHAGWAYSYLEDLNILPIVPALDNPPSEFEGLCNIIHDSLDHEVDVTNQCSELAKSALAENDFMTLELAQKYLKEQVEEIAKTTYWVDRLEAFGETPEALRLLDNEMGE